jgi:hypothetical protein
MNTRDAVGKIRFHSLNPLRLMGDDTAYTSVRYINFDGVEFGNPKVRCIANIYAFIKPFQHAAMTQPIDVIKVEIKIKKR